MHKITLSLLLFTKLASCQRRITNGSSVGDADTSFVVYIVAAKSPDIDPGWLCGGSIIHPSLVLTSAACLIVGTKKMYVISGYKRYITTGRLEQDDCTRRMKKRITSYCVHKSYATDGEPENESDEKKYKWLKFDIGVARTETPIDFYDLNYIQFCSYLPSSIKTNYNSKYERPGSNVIVYGWGHATYYRPEGDSSDYNADHLKFASSLILSRDDCHKFFNSKYVANRVMNHFICTNDKGGYSDSGKFLLSAKPGRSNCQGRRSANNSVVIDGNDTSCFDKMSQMTNNNVTVNTFNATDTRRNGICQNDHGSPLVGWIGGHPFVIGVASAFRVNKKMQCVGPYLYSSVLCTSLFINCILQEQRTIKNRRIASQCDEPINGYKMEETEVDWSNEDF